MSVHLICLGKGLVLQPKNRKSVQPKAIETHCYGHSLNLSVKDATKSNRLINDVLEIVIEITKLVKFSPKREQLLEAVKENLK